MRVILVYPNDRMDTLIPIGLSVLSAHLKTAGHDVKLFDTTFYDTGKETGDFFRESMGQVIKVDLEKYGVKRIKISQEELCHKFRQEVLDYNPGLICFSVLEMTFDQGLELAKAIQDINVPKIFGGVYPTFSPRIVLREPAINMICEGEGEEMLPELATALENREDIRKILNLTVKQDGIIYRSGEIIKLEDLPTGDNIYGEKTGLRRPLVNMANKLLEPDYSIYDDGRFYRKMGGRAVRTAGVELSRGCPFSCGFCCTPMLRYQHKVGREKYSKYSGIDLETLKCSDPHHREKPIDKFIEEAKSAIENYKFEYFFFTDESFLSMSEERFWEFIEKYKKEIGLPFFIETRAETVRPGYAKALEEAGCDGIAIGIESGSLRVRKELLNRLMSNDVIVKAFKEFEKTKIRISANNIIGFPGETREDIMDTVEINRQINPDSIVVNAFRPYSGTELRKKCIEMGLIPKEERVEDNRVYGAFNNGVLSGEEIEGIRKVFNLYVKFPKDRWSEIRRAETNEELRQKLIKEYQEKNMLHREKEQEENHKRKIFVLGIDGAMPEKIFEEWLDDLPNIKKLMREGCYAKMKSTIPPLSVTAWTSMTTGKKPSDHGIFEYLYRNRENALPGKMDLVSSFRVEDKRIWELAGESGKKVISCFVPLTWPAKPYDGILISGAPAIIENKEKKFACPPELEKEIEDVLGKDFMVDIKFFRDLTKKDILEKIRETTQMHIDIMKYLLTNKEWDLFFGVLIGSDRMNHSFWKYCDEQHRKYDPNSEFKNSLKDYYVFLDRELGEMLKLLDEDTLVIVLSDHGFTRMHTRVNLSDWLIKEGYLVLKAGVDIISPVKLEYDMIDWTRTKVFAIGAYDGQVFINLKERDVGGVVEVNDYDSLVDELEIKLKNISGDDGAVLDTKIFKKKDFFRGKKEDLAPDIVIYFDNMHYGANTSLIGNPTLWSLSTAMGSDDATHAEKGIFIMNGDNRKGNIGEINILDIAPTILSELGVKVPDDLEGKVVD